MPSNLKTWRTIHVCAGKHACFAGGPLTPSRPIQLSTIYITPPNQPLLLAGALSGSDSSRIGFGPKAATAQGLSTALPVFFLAGRYNNQRSQGAVRRFFPQQCSFYKGTSNPRGIPPLCFYPPAVIHLGVYCTVKHVFYLSLCSCLFWGKCTVPDF